VRPSAPRNRRNSPVGRPSSHYYFYYCICLRRRRRRRRRIDPFAYCNRIIILSPARMSGQGRVYVIQNERKNDGDPLVFFTRAYLAHAIRIVPTPVDVYIYKWIRYARFLGRNNRFEFYTYYTIYYYYYYYYAVWTSRFVRSSGSTSNEYTYQRIFSCFFFCFVPSSLVTVKTFKFSLYRIYVPILLSLNHNWN